MELRINSGTLKGRKLHLPEQMTDFRPTKSSVREAIISSLAMNIPEATTLELCGGSGIFSFEMISRGASYATVVEMDAKRASFIKKTCQKIGIVSSTEVIKQDAELFAKELKEADIFDIIFFDPPYYTDSLANLLPLLFSHIESYGVLVFEAATDDKHIITTIDTINKCHLKIKKYGKTTIYYLRKEEE